MGLWRNKNSKENNPLSFSSNSVSYRSNIRKNRIIDQFVKFILLAGSTANSRCNINYNIHVAF